MIFEQTSDIYKVRSHAKIGERASEAKYCVGLEVYSGIRTNFLANSIMALLYQTFQYLRNKRPLELGKRE